jgi:hypothetical protein
VGKPSGLGSFGFLTVVGDGQDGFVAGLLTLDPRGRPMEFHCTAPLRPNRAQTILYGPTLRPYIVAEQLARVLTQHVKGRLNILWTDDADVLPVREVVEYPVGLVRCARPTSAPHGAADSTAIAHANPVGGTCDARAFDVHAAFVHDRASIEQAWQEAARWIELWEPFERIREAICEAHRVKSQTSA